MAIKDGTMYEDLMEGLREAYEAPAMAYMTRVRDVIRGAGMYAADPFDMHDDDYRWVVMAWRGPERGPDDDGIDLTLEVAEERSYDDEEGFGVSFGLTIVEYGGRVLSQCQPHNFTPEVWVDAQDPAAVLARWRELESADLSALPDLIRS